MWGGQSTGSLGTPLHIPFVLFFSLCPLQPKTWYVFLLFPVLKDYCTDRFPLFLAMYTDVHNISSFFFLPYFKFQHVWFGYASTLTVLFLKIDIRNLPKHWSKKVGKIGMRGNKGYSHSYIVMVCPNQFFSSLNIFIQLHYYDSHKDDISALIHFQQNCALLLKPE